jgi:hypothetical protein
MLILLLKQLVRPKDQTRARRERPKNKDLVKTAKKEQRKTIKRRGKAQKNLKRLRKI